MDSNSTLGFNSACAESTQPAKEVARGIVRLFARNDIWCAAEVPLANGRRVDLMGVDAKGQIVIVEIKVAHSDLMNDCKWTDYLEYCDRFFWGIPPDFERTLLERDTFSPDRCGMIVGDNYDGEILRDALLEPLASGRRKAMMMRLARLAMQRNTRLLDPHCAHYD